MPRWIEWIQAEHEYGITMPVVPRIDRPPTMPSRPFSVLAASAAPPGMAISISASAARPMRGGDFGDGVADHAPRHRIDRGLAGRNRKSRPRHRADALAGAKRYAGARRAKPHRRDDERAVRHVRIVAGVLDHAGGRRPAVPARHRQREAWPLAARQCHLDRIGKFAGDQRGKRRLRRRGGAGAGGPSPAQWPFLPLHAASFSPARRNRHHGSTPA